MYIINNLDKITRFFISLQVSTYHQELYRYTLNIYLYHLHQMTSLDMASCLTQV